MADDGSDIVSKLVIEGVDDAKSKLSSVGDVGAASFDKIKNAAAASAAAVNESMDRMAQAMAKRAGTSHEDMLEKIATQGKALHAALNPTQPAPAPKPHEGGGGEGGGGGAAEFLHVMRHALHALHPAAEAAGISLGELTPLMYAARGGIVAFGAAIAGTLVAALEKAGDAAKDASARIGGFAGSYEQGKQQYGDLRKTAGSLGVPTSEITGAYEELLRANQKQPLQLQLPKEDLLKIVGAGVHGSEADRHPEEMKGVTEFFSKLREEGQATPKSLDELIKSSPTFGRILTDRLNESGNKTGLHTADEVLRTARDIAPEMEEAAKKVDSHGISQSWTKLKAAIEQQSPGADSGINPISGLIDMLTSGVTSGAKTASEGGLLGKIGGQEGATANLPRRNLWDMLGGKTASEGGLPETRDNQVWGETAKGVESVTEATKAYGESTNKAAKTAGDAIKEFEEKDPRKAIAQARLGVEVERARIDRDFFKKEEEDKLRREKAAVETADFGIRSAKMSHADALKNLGLSQFAGQEAQVGVEGASINAEQARISLEKWEKEHGGNVARVHVAGDLAGEQEDLEERKLKNAKNQADIAEQKAQIEERYSGLIPQKAQLEAEKTQKDITSSQWEKESSQLRLVKDQGLSGLNAEDKQLVYAQKMVDQFDALAKDGNQNSSAIVDKLAEVVDAIKSIGAKGGEGSGSSVITPMGALQYAGGGHIRGAGTGTSDSIPAMLSDNEYVHNAAAVSHYGVGFMDSINSMKLPKFSLGGFVRGLSGFMPMPRFSDGGLASMAPSGPAGHYTVDLRTNHGDFQMIAPEDTARSLARHAVNSKMTSTGKKPDWYGS
jgi:hypothetical protein